MGDNCSKMLLPCTIQEVCKLYLDNQNESKTVTAHRSWKKKAHSLQFDRFNQSRQETTCFFKFTGVPLL